MAPETATMFGVDIELTNRCNAKCYFCPRDQTPHQGLMSPEVFSQSLARAVELRDTVIERNDADHIRHVNLCGLGEPLLNKHAAAFTAEVRATGLECSMSSNAALLDEKRARALLDAGLQRIFINAGDHGEEYDEVYQLPFERTLANIERFVELAAGRCEIRLVLVNHRQDEAIQEEKREFWRARGVTEFSEFEIMNRGGALFVDHMQYEEFPQRSTARELFDASDVAPLCPVPFMYFFIGYDGQYYLCCSDWKKEVPMGSVFDASFMDVMRPKLEHVSHREPVCRTCNLDPLNAMTDVLRAVDEGDAPADKVQRVLTDFVDTTKNMLGSLESFEPGCTQDLPTSAPRRLIPVSTS